MTERADEKPPPSDASRAGVVAVIGATNAGKSTLVNALVGAKISIVTHKVQTTRARVRGVVAVGDAQLVFIDTPGVFRPRRRLDRAMVAAAWESLNGADEIVMVVDAAAHARGAGDRARRDAEAIIAALAERGARVILALNKIDDVPRPKLLPLIAELDAHGIFSETFLISAANGDGLADLKARLAALAPPGPWLYPEDQLSDISDRLMAAEVTREKLYLRLHQELPYDASVETTDWKTSDNGDINVAQTIFVARDSQKPIVLGKGGAAIKDIGQAARLEMADIFGATVHLSLFVKVREGWSEEAARLREIGLDAVE